MKKIYNTPSLNVIHFDLADVIACSGSNSYGVNYTEEIADKNKPQYGQGRSNPIWDEEE